MPRTKKVKYQRLDPISHIHQRSDMYVGAIKPQRESDEWVGTLDNGGMIEKKEYVTYSPGLLRIFVEAVSNTIDNVWRSQQEGVKCTRIKINIDEETGETSVWNDGLTIPIEKHEDTEMYNPELIFGNLLTSSNYDDDEERFTSGRNGLGIKLTNVFSTMFKVKTLDTTRHKLYEQEWSENMRTKSTPKIKTKRAKTGYTEVTWIPDFEKFNMTKYTPSILKVYTKYIFDCAMITGVNVYLNNEKIPIKSLLQYSKCFLTERTAKPISISTDTCDIVITEGNGVSFEYIAFTNGVFNKDGGCHVNAWSEAVFRPILKKLNKPNKPSITLKDIKPYFRLFINCKVPNPEFSSQSKTKLTSPSITASMPQKQINYIMKWSVLTEIKDILKGKEMVSLKKIERKNKSFKKIVGFDPANKKGSNSTLILCEGLSAKTYAVVGIQVGWNGKSGRDWFGIYPLRGKLLNVRNASSKSITNNKEITDAIQIIGLQTGVDYTLEQNYKKLNYGRVMLLTDSDCDGIHISSLVLNFIHTLYPTLLQRTEPFVVAMQTPIVKIFKKNSTLVFYDENKFRDYKILKNDKVKYYKGLGTSSDKEVKESFGKKVIDFNADDNHSDTLIKVFSNKCASRRKEWLTTYNPTTYLDTENGDVGISDYIDKELIKFSIDDCKRSIPNVFDGLKQSQRKILYAVFLKKLQYSGKNTLKVAQLAGFVAEKTNYHHGEQCLFDTITKMAQDFPGSNNIPYLEKDGQFGSLNNLGKDAANARYIFTKESRWVRLLFPEQDDCLLTQIVDDGEIVEPEYYLPIIPTVLLNGCLAGIGTGWSCNIPCYNSVDLINSVRVWLENNTIFEEDEESDNLYSLIDELTPYYDGFEGTIEKVDDDKFKTYGSYSENRNKITVTSIPINLSIEKFKERLEDLLEKKIIKNLKNHSTKNTVNFEFTKTDNFDVKMMKLETSLNTTNMVLFNDEGKIQKFNTVDEIIETFCEHRYNCYITRKTTTLKTFKTDRKWLLNKKRFITNVVDGYLIIHLRPEEDIIEEMEVNNYQKQDKTYNYLLNMSIRSFTSHKVDKLSKEIEDITQEIEELENTTETELWLRDLEQLEQAIN
jgi:DNA topoisomerase II